MLSNPTLHLKQGWDEAQKNHRSSLVQIFLKLPKTGAATGTSSARLTSAASLQKKKKKSGRQLSMLQISQEKEKDLFPLSSVSPRTGIPCVQPDPAAPVKSGSLELPTAALCSLLGLESRIPRKRAEADAFCMLISTNICLEFSVSDMQQPQRNWSIWSILELLSYIFHIYCLTQPEQQLHFYKDKVQGKSLSLHLLLQNVLKAQNTPEHVPVPFSPDLPIVPLNKGRGVTH